MKRQKQTTPDIVASCESGRVVMEPWTQRGLGFLSTRYNVRLTVYAAERFDAIKLLALARKNDLVVKWTE